MSEAWRPKLAVCSALSADRRVVVIWCPACDVQCQYRRTFGRAAGKASLAASLAAASSGLPVPFNLCKRDLERFAGGQRRAHTHAREIKQLEEKTELDRLLNCNLCH